jgi:intracellular septation protein A
MTLLQSPSGASAYLPAAGALAPSSSGTSVPSAGGLAVLEAPITLPSLKAMLRHAVPRVLEGMILPVVVFYVALIFTGLYGALAVVMVWVYGGVAWRLARRQAAPGMMLLAAGAVTIRVVLTALTGNPMFFFLQECLGVFCASMGFLLTASLRRPLIQRVTADLVPLPDHLHGHPLVRRFFFRHSVLWGCAQLLNATLSLWLVILFSQSPGTFLLVRVPAVAVLLGGAALVSVLGFRRCLGALGR